MTGINIRWQGKLTMHWAEIVVRTIPTSLYHSLVRREVIGFFYHVISDQRLPHIAHLYSYKNPQQFENDLLYLKENYTFISYEQLYESRIQKKQLQPGSVLLSFDDGCCECFTIVRPILLKYHIPCIFFLTTNLIDNKTMLHRHVISLCIDKITQLDEDLRQEIIRKINIEFKQSIGGLPAFIQWVKGLKSEDLDFTSRLCEILSVDIRNYLDKQQPYLSSEQIRLLAADGFTIGAHSRVHSKFNTLTSQQVEEEIIGSCQVVEEIITPGKNQVSNRVPSTAGVPFAFPFSSQGVNRELLRQVTANRKVVGLLFDSKGLRQEMDFIFNRVWADPIAIGESSTNLPARLRLAYEDNLLWKMRQWRLYSGTWQPLSENVS